MEEVDIENLNFLTLGNLPPDFFYMGAEVKLKRASVIVKVDKCTIHLDIREFILNAKSSFEGIEIDLALFDMYTCLIIPGKRILLNLLITRRETF